MKRLVGSLGVIGGALLAVGAAEAVLRAKLAPILGAELPLWLDLLLANSLLAGFLSMGGGAALWLWGALRTVPPRLGDLTAPGWDIKPARAQDLPLIDDLSSKAFGPQASNMEQIRYIQKNAFQPFWKVVSYGNRAALGYFCVIRLSAEGERQIEEQTFNSKCPDALAMSNENEDGLPVYIGAVFASGIRSKAAALGGLATYLKLISPKAVHARAATEDGLRILRKYGFSPVHGDKLQIGAFCMKTL
ncbi:MAG: hypothetical protein ACP5EN_06955 [Rhodovulum sp.]